MRPGNNELDDETLVASVALADRGAYAVLVQRHAMRYRALAFRMMGDMAQAEDIVQEAFTKLWTHASRFDGAKAKFTTWFHRIVVNRCLDEKRKRRLDPLPEGFDQADDCATAEEALASEGAAHEIRAAVETLSDRQKTAVILSYFDGLSNQDAADTMELNIKAFESLLVRARAKLREQLMQEKHSLITALGQEG
ncbi:MAG: sigma-70 family RNA polymerase sigma factor [Alphaproteobacteria bacterium]|nr:sigma-70 family RNA polymerase sigma factor [Alphaproteobacteria bacterium]